MTFPSFARSFIVGQIVGWLVLAAVLLVSFTALSRRFDNEAIAREEAQVRIMRRLEELQQDNRRLLIGLTDYIECVAERARDYQPAAPISSCNIYLGG